MYRFPSKFISTWFWVVFVAGVLILVFKTKDMLAANLMQIVKGKATVADRLDEYGAIARKRMSADFSRIGVKYPPQNICLIALKQEKVLQSWVSGSDMKWRMLKTYPVLAASGRLGPKLQQGDRQVPEGVYQIEFLNPNSLYHLSLRVNYPNEFDQVKGKIDGRSRLGSDIMIHGKAASIGCIAIGDVAIEEVFVLAADVGLERIRVIISPVDFRKNATFMIPEGLPYWVPELYAHIKVELAQFQ